ncbi:MAG: hypothetical protein ACOC22_00125 [bacterium]
MGVVENELKRVEGHLISMSRNPMKGWYEIEVGVYKSWVFDNNKDIECKIIAEDDDGKLLKISPKNNKVTVDELIRFVELIIETNERIAEKEREFAKEMEKMKELLEEKAKSFYTELDSLKDSSFKNLGLSLEKGFSNTEIESPKKRGRGRPPKKSQTTSNNVITGTTNPSKVKVIKTEED